MRLAKYLAHAGAASRRAAEELVRAGRVTVAGDVVTDPARDVSDASRVALDGRLLAGPEERVVYMLHKPAGVVSTAADTHGRRTVVDLVPDTRRLYPVGRLDADATGLVLLTNDGELANQLTHPRFEVPRTYRVTVRGAPVSAAALDALRSGVELEDGVTAPARVRRLAPDRLELTIHEGRNRQVKRMCAAVGHPVTALQRVRFGPLGLGTLAPGRHRGLTDAEVQRLRRAARSWHNRPPMRLFALRGAVSVDRDESDEILARTEELMREVMERNRLAPEAMVSCIFTLTPDLNAQFPAVAARRLGLDQVPLLCAREVDVPGALPRVIRLLVHYHADHGHEPRHVYLGEARALREDLHAAQ